MVTLAQPVIWASDLLRRAVRGANIDYLLQRELTERAREVDPYPGQGTLGIDGTYAIQRLGADVWVLSADRDPGSAYQARFEVHSNGTTIYWHSPVISPDARSGGAVLPLLMEQSVTRAVHQHLATAAWLYERSGYAGMVDVGVAVLDIQEARGASIHWSARGPVYGAPSFRRHDRVTMIELRQHLRDLVRRLLGPLFDVISVRDYDPYAASPKAQSGQ